MNKASRGNSSWAISNPKRWCCEKCCKFGKRSSGHRTGKGHFSFQSHSYPKEGNAKEYSNYRTTALISHTSKVMLKILQARFQQYVNNELPYVQDGFRKGRRTRDQVANSHVYLSFLHAAIKFMLWSSLHLTIAMTSSSTVSSLSKPSYVLLLFSC